jgi:hypothetical protein
MPALVKVLVALLAGTVAGVVAYVGVGIFVVNAVGGGNIGGAWATIVAGVLTTLIVFGVVFRALGTRA